jgi:hypothetical protein
VLLATEERCRWNCENCSCRAEERTYRQSEEENTHWIQFLLSGDSEQQTVKPPEWLSLLHDKLARIVAKILYAREISKSESRSWT